MNGCVLYNLINERENGNKSLKKLFTAIECIKRKVQVFFYFEEKWKNRWIEKWQILLLFECLIGLLLLPRRQYNKSQISTVYKKSEINKKKNWCRHSLRIFTEFLVRLGRVTSIQQTQLKQKIKIMATENIYGNMSPAELSTILLKGEILLLI